MIGWCGNSSTRWNFCNKFFARCKRVFLTVHSKTMDLQTLKKIVFPKIQNLSKNVDYLWCKMRCCQFIAGEKRHTGPNERLQSTSIEHFPWKIAWNYPSSRLGDHRESMKKKALLFKSITINFHGLSWVKINGFGTFYTLGRSNFSCFVTFCAMKMNERYRNFAGNEIFGCVAIKSHNIINTALDDRNIYRDE